MNALPPHDPNHKAIVLKVKSKILEKCDPEKMKAALLRKTAELRALDTDAIERDATLRDLRVDAAVRNTPPEGTRIP